MTLLQRWFKVIDFFIPQDKSNDDPFYTYRSRFLVGSIVLAMTIVLFSISIIYLFSPVGDYYGNIVLFGHGVAIGGFLFFFQRSGNITLCSHLITITFMSSMTLWILVSGTIHSSTIMVLIVMPLWAALTIGWRSSIIYCFVAIAIVFFMFLIDKLEFSENIPNFVKDENRAFDNFLLWFITCAVVSAISAIHGFQNARLNTDLHQEKLRATYQAERDALTGIPNRSYFQKLVALHIEMSNLRHSKFAIFYIDLDDFKPINDQYGHLVGDNVLKAVALRLVHELRSSDNLARLGGDEFAATVPNVEKVADVGHIAERLLTAITEPIEIQNEVVQVTGSIGVALFGPHGTNSERMTQSADEAMYKAKTYNNAYCVYSMQPREVPLFGESEIKTRAKAS